MTGPAELTLRQQIVACTPQPGSLTPTKAFAMAEKLADHTGLPLVVVEIQMASGTLFGVNSTVPLGRALTA